MNGLAVLERMLPATRWVRDYRRADLGPDLRAGVTVGVLVVPQAMAYAALAGVPPIAGLYAAMVSLMVYAALGTSRFISVGPVAIDSLLTAAAIAPLANGETGRYVALASVTAVLVGLMQIGAGLLRLGGLVDFLSVPVVTGFTSAAALTIALSQFQGLLGLDVQGSSTTFVAAVRTLVPALPTWSPVTAGLALGAVVTLVLIKRFAPVLPGPLVVVIALTAVVQVAELEVQLVGAVPSGLPVPAIPEVGLADLQALLPAAAAIALVSYLETISTGSMFARRTRTRIGPDRELVAVGTANLAVGLMRGMPVAGGFSRGAVNFNAGARTQLSGVVAAVLVVLALLFLTPLLAHLPTVALAAIIVVSVVGLIDLDGARQIGRINRIDLASLGTTFVATLLFGPAPGLGVGVALSIVLFLRQANRPHMPELGLKPAEGVYRNVRRHNVITDRRLLIVRIDAPLSFAAARPVADRLAHMMEGRSSLTHLVLDCSAVTLVDYTGEETLRTLSDDLCAAGIELHLATVRGPVSDVLMRARFYRDLQEQGRVHPTVARAVESLPFSLV